MSILLRGTQPIEVAATRTATYQTTGVPIGGFDTLRNVQNLSIQIKTSALVGTPNFTYAVEWSNDGTNWAGAQTADVFTAITANGNTVKQFAVKGAYFRLNCTVSGGTPSFQIDSSFYVS